MILHADRYFEHHYDVKLDLVSVKWPTIETIYLPEIYHSVSILVENVINFNIRNLLIDASEAQLKSTHEDANRVVFLLMDGLKRSRLEKLARIESSNLIRENLLKVMVAEMNNTSTFETRFFKDLDSALKWLEAF
jgi:hypothetical protein